MKPIWNQLFDNASNKSKSGRDRDDRIKCPVVAFYSLKGGLGRTTALINTAIELGEQGHKVMCLDLDLEAPSIPDHLGNPDLHGYEGDGIAVSLAKLSYNSAADIDYDREIAISSNHRNVAYIPAGRLGDRYVNAISSLDPVFWDFGSRVTAASNAATSIDYSTASIRENPNDTTEISEITASEAGGNNPLLRFVEELRNRAGYDVILIDCRTGLNPMSAAVLGGIADIIFIGLNPHPQSKLGTGLIVRGLMGLPQETQPFVHFFASPLSGEPEARELQLDRVSSWIEEWINLDGDDVDDIISAEYLAGIEYSKAVSVSTKASDLDWGHAEHPYRQLVNWILQRLPETDHYEDSEPEKTRILRELDFTSGVADIDHSYRSQENSKFIETEFVRKAKKSDTSIVIGRKGTGKSAIFYTLLSEGRQYIPATAPASSIELYSKRGLINQSTIESILQHFEIDDVNPGWGRVWLALIIDSVLGRIEEAGDRGLLGEKLQSLCDGADQRSVEDFALIYAGESSVSLRSMVEELDKALPEVYHVLFDGLDSIFGSSNTSLAHRRLAVQGLLDMARDLIGALVNIKLKVFIRKDIWDQADVQNKTHLRAQSEELAWRNSSDFMRIAVAYALDSSPSFHSNLHNVLSVTMPGFELSKQVAYWPAEAVADAWNLLFGERMAGGRTAFTHKWVWLRTADGNDSHAPRDLLTLLRAATQLEHQFNETGDWFSRCIIRPRALRGAMEDLSDAAFSSFKEEFPELRDLVAKLPTFVANSPFSWDELVPLEEEGLSDQVKLACDVGLIEKPSAASERARIPDIYRYHLGIGRKGQK